MKGYTTVQNNTDPNWWRDAGMRKSEQLLELCKAEVDTD